MKGLLTSRAEVELFERIYEKEDIVPVEFNKEFDEISFTVKKTDFIHRLIDKSKVFAVNIPRLCFEKEADICERHEGEFENKFKLTGLQRLECDTIDCPCIGKSIVYECDLSKEKEEKDYTVVFGTVLASKQT